MEREGPQLTPLQFYILELEGYATKANFLENIRSKRIQQGYAIRSAISVLEAAVVERENIPRLVRDLVKVRPYLRGIFGDAFACIRLAHAAQQPRQTPQK